MVSFYVHQSLFVHRNEAACTLIAIFVSMMDIISKIREDKYDDSLEKFIKDVKSIYK